MDRVAKLEELVRTTPNDPFPRYGLALEHKNQGRFEEARQVFIDLVNKFPNYAPSYLHAGRVLMELGRLAEAKSTYQTGIEVCIRAQDHHARSELEAALAEIESSG